MGTTEANVSVTDDKTVENVTIDVAEKLNDVSEEMLKVSDDQVGSEQISKEGEGASSATKKGKKKFRHGKKGPSKDNSERNLVRRVHYTAAKFKQIRKRTQSFPSFSKFFLPYKRPRKDAFIPPTKFLLGGNISDPLNLNSLQDEDINRAMNAVTPESSPLPTPPRHKAKIDVIIPPNIRDPLNLIEPLDNDEYEKRLQVQHQRKPRNKPKIRRRTTENVVPDVKDSEIKKEETIIKEPEAPEPVPSTSKSRKRSCSETESQKGKDSKKLRRMDSLDKIVSPVVPQPGAWMRARPQTRTNPQERPVSPHRSKPAAEGEEEKSLPKFNPKNNRYQYGNYDRYYGYRNLNASLDVRLQVFEMHRHLFQNKDVLDIGCNVGHVSIAIAKDLGARSVVGIDIDPVLIGRARKNLRSYIPIPSEEPESHKSEDKKMEIEVKKEECDKCDQKCDNNCSATDSEQKDKDDGKKAPGKKIRRPRKNRKAVGKPGETQCYFPLSMAMLYGPIPGPAPDMSNPTFPYNVTFKQANYVPREEISVGSGAETAQYDLILCLSTTKWLHLNWGDAGLKRAFRRMFNDLRPGGKLVIEAQNWASYKKKKRLTQTIYENFNSIEMFPSKFREYLLSPEVGFSNCCILGIPQHTNKGFRRPIQLYIKGDFTPSKASWSDAYIPSSHHKPEAEPPRRTVYAPVAPAYRPSDDAPSCGAATPYSPNLECCADDSPFYNPRSDSYAPSYEPPRPTVYATVGSPVGASPLSSPAASPHPEHMSARVYLAPTPPHRAQDD